MNQAYLKYALTGEAAALGCKFQEPRAGDAGYDIYAATNHTLFPGQQSVIPTGLIIEIPKGWVGMIKDRSSLAMRRIYTHAGIIDSSFRGELTILLENGGDKPSSIISGDRIAQIIFAPVLILPTIACAKGDFTASQRGEGSFGSTGR